MMHEREKTAVPISAEGQTGNVEMPECYSNQPEMTHTAFIVVTQ